MTHTNPRGGVLGVILAGGEARRMGGGDKCLIEIDGRSLLARIVERLRPMVDDLVLVAGGAPERFGVAGCDVVADPPSDRPQGPLAGIVAALGEARGRGYFSICTVPGDAPLFPLDYVSRLHAAAERAEADCAVAAADGRVHPIFALYRTSLAGAAADAFARGIRAPWRLQAAVASVTVDFGAGPYDPFEGANTPEELVRLGRRLRTGT